MSILVTGGAGFIGSNFIQDWFATDNEPVVNLDALTYAGNPNNLITLPANAAHTFVHGDIGDRDILVIDAAILRKPGIVAFKIRLGLERQVARHTGELLVPA